MEKFGGIFVLAPGVGSGVLGWLSVFSEAGSRGPRTNAASSAISWCSLK